MLILHRMSEFMPQNSQNRFCIVTDQIAEIDFYHPGFANIHSRMERIGTSPAGLTLCL
jgi:hypothetical protein